AAKNDSAFSGGSKKQVTVVSKDDIVKLKASLLKSLQDKGGEELAKSANNGEFVLPIILNASVTKTKFDKNVGDTAAKTTLTGTVSFSGVSYNNDDLSQ